MGLRGGVLTHAGVCRLKGPGVSKNQIPVGGSFYIFGLLVASRAFAARGTERRRDKEGMLQICLKVRVFDVSTGQCGRSCSIPLTLCM